MIDAQDKLKQKKVYSINGQGRWSILGYIPEPSVTMINLDTGRKLTFGLSGAMNNQFEETDEPRVDAEIRQAVDMGR